MPKHVTKISEIRDEGIFLQTKGEQVVRVLGTLKEVPRPVRGLRHHEWSAQVDGSVYESYHGGSLKGPQDDPQAKPHHPAGVTFFVTRTGEVVFLEREWT